MNLLNIFLVVFLSQTQAQVSLQSQELYQNPQGYYFFNVYMGQNMQARGLLLDTQANGTAVRYNYKQSFTHKVFEKMHGKVLMPSSYSQSAGSGLIEGFAAFDELSFDADELVSVDEFMFLFTNKVRYPELDDEIDGVIGFNRFGFTEKHRYGLTHGMHGKTNVMKALFDDRVLANDTVQFDLNPKYDKDGEYQQSYIYYNGNNMSNIQDDKVYYFQNIMNNSNWVINIEEAYVNESDSFNFYQKNKDTRKCPGVIATASQTIKLPKEDFEALATILQTQDPSIELTSDKTLMSQKQCSQLNLQSVKFKFKSDLLFEIPLHLYTQDQEDFEEYKCRILFEPNIPQLQSSDDFITDEDRQVYEANQGYILGAPFVRSFMVILQFESNRIGLAQKVQNNGALIVKEEEPIHIDPEWKNQTQNDDKVKNQTSGDYEQHDQDTDTEPVEPTKPDEKTEPSDPSKPSDSDQKNQTQKPDDQTSPKKNDTDQSKPKQDGPNPDPKGLGQDDDDPEKLIFPMGPKTFDFFKWKYVSFYKDHIFGEVPSVFGISPYFPKVSDDLDQEYIKEQKAAELEAFRKFFHDTFILFAFYPVTVPMLLFDTVFAYMYPKELDRYWGQEHGLDTILMYPLGSTMDFFIETKKSIGYVWQYFFTNLRVYPDVTWLSNPNHLSGNDAFFELYELCKDMPLYTLFGWFPLIIAPIILWIKPVPFQDL